MNYTDISEFGKDTAFGELMAIRGKGAVRPGLGQICVSEPVWDSKFYLGETTAQILSGVGVALSDLSMMKFGREGEFSINQRHLEAHINSHRFTKIMGKSRWESAPEDPHLPGMRRMTQPWPTADDRWVVPHFNLNHLKDRVLAVLGCPDVKDEIPHSIRKWKALELEQAIAEARACCGMVRTQDEWLSHSHGKLLAAKPVVEIERIGDGPKKELPDGERLLSGLRVLDLTRILAGPLLARTLAEQGADVLMIAGREPPQVLQHVRDTSHGKRSAILDIDRPGGREILTELIRTADVFSQGYRPGVMDSLGFGPRKLAEINAGIIYVSTSCFGEGGPFSDRAGWEQIAQAVTGICHANGNGTTPTLIPVTACDYMCGYLGAYGALAALRLRAELGGSWHVKVSLCQVGMLLLRQGLLETARETRLPTEHELEEFQMVSETGYGKLRHFKPVLHLSGSPAKWDRVTPLLGSSAPEWL